MAKRILLVEDEPSIRQNYVEALRKAGYEVQAYADRLSAEKMVAARLPDLALLDVCLQDDPEGGFELCRSLRTRSKTLPIIFLTALDSELDKISGIRLDADDYLTKPFGVREFIARVKAILRRQSQNNREKESTTSVIKMEGLEIDQEKRKVTLNGERIYLTPKEFDLLVLLATNKGRSYDRGQLLQLIWGYEFLGYEHTVNSHINRLRTKIEPADGEPKYILTTWGVGYRFNDEL